MNELDPMSARPILQIDQPWANHDGGCTHGGSAPAQNAPGTLWRLVSADEVPEGAETAATAADDPQGDGEEAPGPRAATARGSRRGQQAPPRRPG